MDKRHSNDRWDHACTCPVLTWKHNFWLPGAGKILLMISLSSVPGLVWPTTTHSIKYLFSPLTNKPSEQLCLLKYWQVESTAGRGDPDFSSAAADDRRGPIMVRHLSPSVCRCLWLFTTHTALLQHFHILPIQLVVVYLKKEIMDCNPWCFLFRLSAIFLVVRRLHHQLCGNFVCVCLQHRPAAAFEGFFCQPGDVIPFKRLASMILVALKCLKFKAELMNIVSFTEYFYNELETCQKLRMKRGKGCFTWTNSRLTDIHDTYDQNRQLLQHKTPSLSNKWDNDRNGAQLMGSRKLKRGRPGWLGWAVKMSFTGFPEETNPGIQVQGAVPRKVRR